VLEGSVDCWIEDFQNFVKQQRNAETGKFMDLPLESSDFIRLFSEWSTLTPEGRIARNQNLVAKANSNILMTQVSAKSPRIPTSISENLEIYN